MGAKTSTADNAENQKAHERQTNAFSNGFYGVHIIFDNNACGVVFSIFPHRKIKIINGFSAKTILT